MPGSVRNRLDLHRRLSTGRHAAPCHRSVVQMRDGVVRPRLGELLTVGARQLIVNFAVLAGRLVVQPPLAHVLLVGVVRTLIGSRPTGAGSSPGPTGGVDPSTS